MSKLSKPDNPKIPPKLVKTKIIRNRKKNPIHPEEIQRLLIEEAKASKVTLESQEWLLILYKDDGSGKHYSDIKGTYEEAIKTRNDIMESGDYEKSWLILKKGDR